MSNEPYDYEGEAECIAQRPKAIKVRLENRSVFWVPQTCVHEDSEVYRLGDRGKLVVAEWWHEKQMETNKRYSGGA